MIDESICEFLYTAVHVCHLAYKTTFNKMCRVIPLYISSPEAKAFILFQQHKWTEKAVQTAENITLGPPCCKNSADVLGRGTQALPHWHAFGCSIAVKLAGLWHWVAVHRESFSCSEMAILHLHSPREAGAQVPNRCTVWPWHCGDCCCPPTLGTHNQQVHQLLPHQPHCRVIEERQMSLRENVFFSL